MVRIRLRRTGSRGQPSYRIVVADKESPRDGRFLEIVGFYNPRTEPGTLEIKEDRIYEWMNNGALPTESAARPQATKPAPPMSRPAPKPEARPAAQPAPHAAPAKPKAAPPPAKKEPPKERKPE